MFFSVVLGLCFVLVSGFGFVPWLVDCCLVCGLFWLRVVSVLIVFINSGGISTFKKKQQYNRRIIQIIH